MFIRLILFPIVSHFTTFYKKNLLYLESASTQPSEVGITGPIKPEKKIEAPRNQITCPLPQLISEDWGAGSRQSDVPSLAK